MATRGRKAFEPTEEQAAMAREMIAAGAKWKAVAAAIGVSEPTARKLFGDAPPPRPAAPDLFEADPVAPRPAQAPRAGAGRKRWSPGHFEREKVALLIAAGMSVEDIGRVLGKSPPTIRRVFAEEFRTGAARKEAELLEAMIRGAKSGNAAMAKMLAERFERARMADANRDFLSRQDVPVGGQVADDDASASRVGPIGKKEERQAEAFEAARDPDWEGRLQSRVRLN